MITGKKTLLLMTTLGILVALVAGCRAFAPAYEYKGTLLEPPLPIPDFELKDTREQPFHLSDVEGNIALVYFGYTFCPDVCPLTLWNVKNALKELEGKERVKVIFISVDPDRDTPEVVGRYLTAFDPNFIGLTGDFEKVKTVMKPFGAFAEKEEVKDSAAQYLMTHTASLYLLNPQRELMLIYPFGFEADDLRSDLSYLLQQSGG